MKISVIVPTYNEEKDILSCLASLKEQSVGDFEVIVVDDGSTDNTVPIITNSKFQIPNLKLLEQEHRGAGAARNLGAKGAEGEILVFVDADMTFDPKFLQNLVRPVEHKTAKGTFSKEEYVSNWENVWGRCWNLNNNLFSNSRLPDDYPNHQKVFRAILKSEFLKAGGFDENVGYTDDWTLSTKLGYEAEASHSAVFYHKNPDNLNEVFSQARWVVKRKYKLGMFGVLFTLFRFSFPVSIVVGIWKSVARLNFAFIVFKLIYDFGGFVGLIEYVLFAKSKK